MGCKGSKDISEEALQVFRKYDIGMLLGNGCTSEVHEAELRETGAIFAIKCIVRQEAERQSQGPRDFANEISIMKIMNHPSVCKFHESFADELIVYYVMECCNGEKLFHKLEEDIVLEEAAAMKMCKQMVDAVAHVHSKGVAHLDLKPENWVIGGYLEAPTVKLLNFGLAEWCKGGAQNPLTQACGTLHYVAPEVLRGAYGLPADLWTLGVVMFLMMYGAYPFDGDSCQAVMRAILINEPDYSDSRYVLSNDAKDILKRLLVKESKPRLTAQGAQEHGWFQEKTDVMSPLGGSPRISRGRPSSIKPRHSIISIPGPLVRANLDGSGVDALPRSAVVSPDFLAKAQPDQAVKDVLSPPPTIGEPGSPRGSPAGFGIAAISTSDLPSNPLVPLIVSQADVLSDPSSG